MFRIRRLSDVSLPTNRREVEQVQSLLAARLPGLSASEIEALPDRLRDPLAHRLHAILLVADDLRGNLKGFALLSHAPDVGFCLLDYVVTDARHGRSGIGGALYERTRETARDLGAVGLFFECSPDDEAAVSDPAYLQANRARLRFYEQWGARPIVGTGYEAPLQPGQLDMPNLVFDDLDSGKPLPRELAQRVVRAILERKYPELCPPAYVEQVVASFVDDPVRLRTKRYSAPKRQAVSKPLAAVVSDGMIVMVVNDAHQIHHVRERGYVEAPVRIDSIRRGIEPLGTFWTVEPHEYPLAHIEAVHDREFVAYLRRACASVAPGKSIYPYVFPVRNRSRPPVDLAYRAGYYCIDTFTPLNQNAWRAARRAVDCALTAADALLAGQRYAYALVRPPGHHAERASFGGFCYLNNAAVAAHHLSLHGKVAILDLDYHHGNGQQDIFWTRSDVLTVSIHGHPRFAYPFFCGFAEETGEADGRGFNLNLPLPEDVDGPRYRKSLDVALTRIERFAPKFLVVCLGLDTARGDPTGSWSLAPEDFELNAQRVARLGLPTLVVQEGGYRTVSLGRNAKRFFAGLVEPPPNSVMKPRP